MDARTLLPLCFPHHSPHQGEISRLIAEFSGALRSFAPQPFWTAFDAVKSASKEWAASKSEGPILDSILEVEDLLSAVARARNLGGLFAQLVPRKSAKSGKKPAELLLEALASVHKALTIVQILMLRHLDEQLAQKDRSVLLVADRERVDLPELELARRLTGLRVMHARSAQAARDQASTLVEESEGNAHLRLVLENSDATRTAVQLLRTDAATKSIPLLLVGKDPKTILSQALPLQAKDALLLATTESSLLRSFVELPSFMLDGERTDETIDDVQLERAKVSLSTGTGATGSLQLLVTNFRLAFVQASANNPILELDVPLGVVLRVEHTDSKGKAKGGRQSYRLICRDMRIISFSVPDRAPKLAKLISKYNTDGALESVFAPAHCESAEKGAVADSGWNTYSLHKEMQRQGLLFGGKWKMVSQEDFELCPSYPLHFAMPSSFSTSRIPAAGKVRVEGRFPVLCWFHSASGVALARAAQETSDADATLSDNEKEDIMASLAKANPKGKLLIVDMSANADLKPERKNALRDKYLSRPLHLPATAEFSVAFKRLLDAWPALLTAEWSTRVEESGYLGLVRKFVSYASEISGQMRSGVSVLLQSDDGADAVALLACLIQLLLDPYYRTQQGFSVLVEREWLMTASSVGWRGKSKRKVRDDDLLAAPFVMFIDCVHQLWVQQPSVFEFNEAYLLALLGELYTGRFGTFLVTGEKDRTKLKLAHRTHSAWQHLAALGSGYRSPVYVPEAVGSQLLSKSSIEDEDVTGAVKSTGAVMGSEVAVSGTAVLLWHGYFLARADLSALDRFIDAFDKATRRRNALPSPSITLNKTLLATLPDALLASAENVSSLRKLDLCDNALNMVPLSLARLTAITSLHFARNRFTAYPRYALFHLGQSLPHLIEIDLSGNQLEQFYADALVRLRVLRLDCNRLGELSPSISYLTALTALHAAGNAPLASVPWDLPESLCTLSLSGGALTKLPSSLGRLTRLETLLLDANSLDSLPDDLLVRLTSLVTLSLSKNPLAKRKSAAPPSIHKGQQQRSSSPQAAPVGALDFLRQTSSPSTTGTSSTSSEPASALDFLRQTSTPTITESAAPSVGPLDFLRQTSVARAVSPVRPPGEGSPVSAQPLSSTSSGSVSSIKEKEREKDRDSSNAVAVGPLDFLRQTSTDDVARQQQPAKSSMSPLDFLRETSSPVLLTPHSAERITRGSEIAGRHPRSHRETTATSHSAESSPRVAHAPTVSAPSAAGVDPLSFLRQTTARDDNSSSDSPTLRHQRPSPSTATDVAKLVPVRVAPPASLLSTDAESVLPRIGSTRLLSLHIASLDLAALPSRLWSLTQLTELNISGNKFDTLPLQLGDLIRLKILNADVNHISRLPLELGRLTALEELRVAGNVLQDLSPVIARMSGLTLLDISRNTLLTELPPQLGQLKALKTLSMEGIELRSSQKEAAAQGLSVLLGVLQDQCKEQERVWRARLVVLGESGVGKSSLVRALMRKGKGKATEASTEPMIAETWSFEAVNDDDAPVAAGKIPVLRPLAGAKAGSAKSTTVTLSVFDLSVPEMSTAHPLILTERTIYVLVCNLARPLSEARLDWWMRAVAAKSSKNVLVIVGTHIDDKGCTKDFLAEQFADLERRRSPVLKAVRSVSAETGRGIEELRAEIEQLALRLDKMGENVPVSVLALERLAQAERRMHIPPILSWDHWREMAAACLVPADNLPAVTALLTNLGSITHYPVPQLRDVVLLEPHWPLEALASLFQAPPSLALGPDGFIAPNVLAHVWREPRFSASAHALLITIFMHFDILFTSSPDLSDKTSLLTRFLLAPIPPAAFPALWPHTWHSNAPVAVAPAGSSLLYARRYRFDAIPRGFLGRLMGRLLRFTTPKCLWQSGMLLDCNDTRAFLTLEADSLSLFLHAPSYVPPTDAFAVLRQLFTVIGALIRDWYRIAAQLSFYCPHCLASGAARDAVHEIPASTVNDAVARGLTSLTCPLGEGVTLQLDRLAPDMLFVAPERVMPHSALKLQEKLGSGGFATVYKADYRGSTVAVKELAFNALSQGSEEEAVEKPGAREELFDCFRHEASVMASLAHPHIIYLVGYALSPPSLVMELMNAGDLHNLLHASDLPLAWPARLKLVHDVATAIAYMHSLSPPVLHRDLKSPNVLLNKDKAGKVTAKLADFGTAVVLHCGTALGRVVDNPMWLAPEVLENLEYSVAADTYAFGIIAWEAAARAEFFPELRFWTQQERVIIHGVRPPIPSDTPAEFRAVIEACWAPRPSQRLPMATVLERLTAILPSGAACVLSEKP